MDSTWRETETTTVGERLFPTEEAFPDQLKLFRYRMQLASGLGLLLVIGTFLIDPLDPPKNAAALWGIRAALLIAQFGFFMAFRWEGLTLPRLSTLVYLDYLVLSLGLTAALVAGEQAALFTAFHALAVSMLLLPVSPTQATAIQLLILVAATSLAAPSLRTETMQTRSYLAGLLMYLALVVIVRMAAGMTFALRLSEAKTRGTIEEAMRKLNFLSSYDHLTRVANRSNFENAVEAAVLDARSMNQPLAYLEIDLDYFKKINDELGHQAGDAVLRAASERIAGCLRTGDEIGRMGGDEFAVLIRGATMEVASTVASRILQAFKNTQLATSWGEIQLSCTVGIAWFPGWGSITSNALMAAADESLYEAKEAGRCRVGSVRSPQQPEMTPSGEFPVPGTATFSGKYVANPALLAEDGGVPPEVMEPDSAEAVDLGADPEIAMGSGEMLGENPAAMEQPQGAVRTGPPMAPPPHAR